ncbi:MAG: hypothetical protein CMI31_14525 [Opitutae bacterium]|nr:hypothetical protein [Opitutae bacterium]|tara:strand:- start:2487 stop:3341 length:855 start_codon:yes stop_codon:yes gene_type:complete
MESAANKQTFDLSSRLLWYLRWLVVFQCAGYAAQLATPSSLNSWLLESLGDSAVSALDAWVARILWIATVALPALGIVRPIGVVGRHWPARCEVLILGFAAAWALSEAFFSWRANLGNPFHATDPYGHAVRYLAPVALLLLWSGKGIDLRIEWALRFAVAGTFIGHGLCCWWLKPAFLDLILGSLDTFFGIDWESAAEREFFAKAFLPWIAVQDFILAGLILLPKRLRWVALWMAFWGFVTALSRLTAFGWERWPDLFIRICNGGIPLLLWLHWRNLFKNRFSL